MLVTLNEVLKDAQKNRYAVGLFNATDSDMLQAVISAAEELRSPVIIGTAEVLLPFGELSLIAPSMVHAAKNASVPVVVHFDHGLTPERCTEALELGFSSVMFDGSGESLEENLRSTAEMVKLAHSMGASVEGEIGHVGSADDSDGENRDMYTTPREAVDFVKATGVDALAVAIGTAHGTYKTKPRLDIERLKLIRAALDTPLVLHGGSGLSDDDFRATVREGITKINIFTDLCLAGEQAMGQAVTDLSRGMMGYLDIRQSRVAAMKAAAMEKLSLFGSQGRA